MGFFQLCWILKAYSFINLPYLRRNNMAKVTYRDASKDDPIYKEGFLVSSHSYSREYVTVTHGSEINKDESKDKDVSKDER